MVTNAGRKNMNSKQNYNLHTRYVPPLVSIIITNYNYADHVAFAIQSIKSQSYKNIELIIVDDCSSDESILILKKICEDNPSFTLICKKNNEGQTAAFVDGFQKSSGQYVVFLDADDLLLDDFVETHVIVNLSLRVPVGFTTSDIIQTVEDDIVNGSFSPINDYIRMKKRPDKNMFRDVRSCFPAIFGDNLSGHLDLESKIYYYKPGNFNSWVFAPTSGCFYRRDALNLVLGEGRLRNLKLNADTYLNKAIALITGAIVIDIPMTVRRLHGSNGFVDMAELNCCLSIDPKKVYVSEYFTWKEIVNLLIEKANIFIPLLGFETYSNLIFTMQKQRVNSLNFCHVPDLPKLDDLSNYINQKLDTHSNELSYFLATNTDIRYIKDGVNNIINLEIRKNIFLKFLAEFLLTFGRIGVPFFEKIGVVIWNKSGY